MKQSFVKRITFFLLLTIFISFFLCAIVTYLHTKDTLYNNAIDRGIQTVNSDKISLEIYFQYMRKTAMNLYYNTNIYRILRAEEHSYEDRYELLSYLRSSMDLSSRTPIVQIYLHLYHSEKAYLVGQAGRTVTDSPYPVDIPADTPLYTAYTEQPHNFHTYGTRLNRNRNQKVCSFHWNISNPTGETLLGTLSFDIDVSTFAQYLDGAENNTVALLDANGNLIYTNDPQMDAGRFQEILASCAPETWSSIETPYFHGIAFHQTLESQDAPWQLLRLESFDLLYEDANHSLVLNLLLLTLSCFLCVSFCAYIVYHATRPLISLNRYVQRVECRDLTAHISDYTQYCRKDEIGNLIVHVERMMDNINELFQRQQMLSRAHRNAEAKMLQSQINPHFLYNALQSIGSLSLQHGDKEVYRLLTMLGSRMQYSMNLEQASIELRQEFQYVQNYLTLQNVRFDNRISTELLMGPGTEDIPVPKMLLQPLVENSFKHGELCRKTFSYLKIHASLQESVLTITVEDNGTGLSTDRLEEINETLRQINVEQISTPNHIGLKNTLYRLKLLYGNDASMELKPVSGGGILVSLQIPLNHFSNKEERHESTDCGR